MLKSLIGFVIVFTGFQAQAELLCGRQTSVTMLDSKSYPERDAVLLIKILPCPETVEWRNKSIKTIRVDVATYDASIAEGRGLDVISREYVGNSVCVHYTATDSDLLFQSYAKFPTNKAASCN